MIFDKIGAIRITPARFFGFRATLFTLVIALTSCLRRTSMCSSPIPLRWKSCHTATKSLRARLVELRF